MLYSKKEVVELAKQYLGVDLSNERFIPLPVLQQLGLVREWNRYRDVA